MRENSQTTPCPRAERTSNCASTEEELDFIINHDIKYRLGRDTEGEEE